MVSSCPLLWGLFDHAVFHALILQSPTGAFKFCSCCVSWKSKRKQFLVPQPQPWRSAKLPFHRLWELHGSGFTGPQHSLLNCKVLLAAVAVQMRRSCFKRPGCRFPLLCAPGRFSLAESSDSHWISTSQAHHALSAQVYSINWIPPSAVFPDQWQHLEGFRLLVRHPEFAKKDIFLGDFWPKTPWKTADFLGTVVPGTQGITTLVGHFCWFFPYLWRRKAGHPRPPPWQPPTAANWERIFGISSCSVCGLAGRAAKKTSLGRWPPLKRWLCKAFPWRVPSSYGVSFILS